MARGRTLNQLLTQLQAEAGMSLLPASGVSTRDHRVQLLNRVQARLYGAFDWEFAFTREDVIVSQGAAVYPMPSTIDFDRINQVNIAPVNTDDWRPLGYRATDADYRVQSEGSQGAPQKWTPQDTNFVLWPTPDAGYRIRFRGARVLPLMVNDSDRAVLDDTLIVMHAASELMKRAKLPDYEDKLREGQMQFQRLKAQQSGNKRQPIINGGGQTGLIGDSGPRLVPGLDYIQR